MDHWATFFCLSALHMRIYCIMWCEEMGVILRYCIYVDLSLFGVLHFTKFMNKYFYLMLKKLTVQIHYNLQNHPQFPYQGDIGPYCKKKRVLYLSIWWLWIPGLDHKLIYSQRTERTNCFIDAIRKGSQQQKCLSRPIVLDIYLLKVFRVRRILYPVPKII